MLELSQDEALTLATILDNVRSEAVLGGLTAPSLNEQYAWRLLNSAIDPIISQLETGLEFLGAR